jgi:methionyl-tRNA formyltransferase
MRIIFMGTPEFSVSALDALIQAGHEILCVYSQPPRPAGRGKKDQCSPVHLFAQEKSIEVRTPISLKLPEEQEYFAAMNADIAVVVAYGLLLPKAILNAPKKGCVNIHASLLPRWRGAAPIQRAIEAGDTQTGIAIMQMDAGLDTGDILMQHAWPITNDTTGGALHDDLSVLGAKLIVTTLEQIDSISPVPQAGEGVTYAKKITKEEALIDWHMPAEQLVRKIHAFNPYPGMYFCYQSERIKILSAQNEVGQGKVGEVVDDELRIACATGVLKPLLIQRQGKKPMQTKECLRGFGITKGSILT